MKVFRVYVRLDEKSQVWYVDKSDVPGLHVEADSQDELLKEVLALLPELIVANGLALDGGDLDAQHVPIELIASQREHIALAC
jgi:predicted RNase H-like HicB family nuclease